MKIRRVDYSPDEMIAGIVGQMDPVDFGVYWMVCTLIYSRGGPIRNDPQWIAGIFKKTNPRTIRAALDRLEASGKVQRTEGELMVNRCRSELERALNRTRKASENGMKGGRPSKENNNLTKAGGFQDEKLTINEQPSTNNQQPTPPLPPQGGDAPNDNAKTKRGTRLGIKEPPPDWLGWAQSEGHPAPEREWQKFRDYWIAQPGQKGVKLDWQATWRNWVRRAMEQVGRSPPRPVRRGMAEPAPKEAFSMTPEEIAAQDRVLSEEWGES